MKKIIMFSSLLFLIGLQSDYIQVFGKSKSAVSFKRQSYVNLRARNSTANTISVQLTNTTTGVVSSFTVPPNTPSEIVIGQIPENNDIYNARMTSPQPVTMQIYWAYQSYTTSLYAEGMAIGCSSCAQINISN